MLELRSLQTPQDDLELLSLAERWRQQQRQSSLWAQRQEERDLAHWQRLAPEFDNRHSLAAHCPPLLARLLALASDCHSAIDLGAGTGEFSLPLAQLAAMRTVTAVDYSAPMLHQLARKATAARLSNLSWRNARWEEAEVAPHDLVLLVNALYRTDEIMPALRRIEGLARRRVVLCLYGEQKPDWRVVARRSLGFEPWRAAAGPALLRRILHQWGRQPHCEQFSFSRQRSFATAAQACEALSLAPNPRTEAALAALLPGHGEGLSCQSEQTVELLWWEPCPGGD